MAVDPKDLGPLAGLVGLWEGNDGLDVAYSHSRGMIWETPYREKCSFNSFGPVDNGRQALFGLDYRSAMWRDDEENPFHTEIGYWLWDAAAGSVMRCFMVPRGSVVFAGGNAAASDVKFSLAAELGQLDFGVLSNPYLNGAAKVIGYTADVVADGNAYTYEQDTTLEMDVIEGVFHHTDRNTLHKTS
jgi:hypothetical protein